MYVNQIDNIIDSILDKLYLEGISKDKVFRTMVDTKNINFVEYQGKINNFIQEFMKTIDTDSIKKVINNKENLAQILNIIKRYVAYYYFLSLVYYYTGTIKEFRNNLIQYSKLQENSTFTIKNFFDTENNYQIITFFKIIKDVIKIITLTDLQKKTLDPLQVKDAIKFLNSLGREYVDNYLLMIVQKTDGENTENEVVINVHNLIKTIVFGEIYRNQEQTIVFEILNDIEEDKYEYTYIDIVVDNEDATDYESFRQIFLGEKNTDVIAKDLFDLVNDTSKIPTVLSIDSKNNKLLEFNIITPIVDDFLRYHRDSERMENENNKIIPLIGTTNAKNMQTMLQYQQRKKKENTKVQLIVNKIDAISDYYSNNVKNNPELLKDIKKFFQGPMSYRKSVMYNYLEEVHVMNKILNQGRRAMEGNEYFVELENAIWNAYFNFKDFQKYGVSISLTVDKPLDMLRYSNIENKNQQEYMEVDMHTGTTDNIINVVGLAIGPFENGPIQCCKKENLLDIREIKLAYYKNGKVVSKINKNGFKAYLKVLKHFYINPINVKRDGKIGLWRDMTDIRKLNPNILDKIIYWIYDIELDTYNMDTYENLKSHNFQETIRYMNGIIYDKLMGYLRKKINKLIENNLDMSMADIETLVENFSTCEQLFLKSDDKTELIVKEYLKPMPQTKPKITEINEADRIEKPMFNPTTRQSSFMIKIDMLNPLHPQEIIKIEAYSKDSNKSLANNIEQKCQHENEWNEMIKLKTQNLNKYNEEVIQFMDKFVKETTELEFVCRVCGQVLPLKQYVQDGRFDNNTQKFITAYVPLDMPLEDIKEYQNYRLVIKYLDLLLNRLSLITGTNMLSGHNSAIKQKRKALVKNMIDLIVLHNSVNMKKNISEEDRLDFNYKKFNVDKDLDSVYFFELDDSMLDFKSTASETNADINKLKYNNVLLYFILIFISELNGAQISMMNSDKIANIYVYLKWGPKLFGDLLIKKNVTDMETVPITRYPVLCYLIFLISYYLVKYDLWIYPSANSKKFNPYYQKIIINSIIALFNSISIDAGKMPDDYIYLLTTSKLYSQLNNTFQNSEIINLLRQRQLKYSDEKPDNVPVVAESLIKTHYFSDPITIITKPLTIPNFKISSGIQVDNKDNIMYHGYKTITDITNCSLGSYHQWQNKGPSIQCNICKETGDQVSGDVVRLNDAYYFNLNKIANRRCIQGTVHDFVGKNGKFVCTICGRQADQTYSKEDLDKLSDNLNKLIDANVKKIFESTAQQAKYEADEINAKEATVNDLFATYKKEFDDQLYGQTTNITDKFIKLLESLIGQDTNLDIDKYPVYLRDSVYIIDHSYNGTLLPEPYIITQKDNRILFRENNTFFKTDVYYYTDNRTQTDVFYHAVTLKLLGYKEKHKEYQKVNKANAYLLINPSIRDRILMIGYETRFINIEDNFIKNSKYITDTNKNYFQILDNLIRDHIFKVRTIIDKISSIMYKIKNYQPTTSEDTAVINLYATQALGKLITKYSKMLANVNIGDNNTAFDDWKDIRYEFTYKPIGWDNTNIRPTENMYVNSDLINYYDINSNVMIYYLINELTNIINSNNEKITKTNIAQMYVELIIYIYNLYNTDRYRNSLDLKRFDYILNGSDVMIDILKRGQGAMQSKELEENLNDIGIDVDVLDATSLNEDQQEELEDLREEAEALDLEGDYYAEEDEDYAQQGEYDE